MTAVENGEAVMVVKNPVKESASPTRAYRVAGAGSSTNDLSKMTHLYKMGNGTQVYKPWKTVLGTWNSASGRPDYLLDKTDQALINEGLVFSEEEIYGMFNTACDALNSATDLKEQYRAAADLRMLKDSEISITALGSSTCWNSSLGYYYYNENKPPQNKMDLNIIMIFPNTQDGQWPRGSYPNNKYNGNIGAVRGDVVQLMYYPPTDDGGIDITKGTTIFPAGTKIGFMLKTNAWAQRGKEYAVNGSYNNKKNIWASTTDGFSYAPDGGKCPNPDGEARSAKFAYTAPNGNQYVVVSFEDACDDKDYDDLMFALNPADAFDFDDVAKIENRRATTYGVYGFEDKWPDAGDYDMNDLMINCKHELEFYQLTDGSKKLNKERFYLTTYHNYITLKNGLAVDLQGSDIATIYVNKLLPGQTKYASETYTMQEKKYYYLPEIRWGGKDDTEEKRMWYLTDDITKDENKTTGEGVTWVFEVTYSKGLSKSGTTIRPFLWRSGNNGQVEVHLPWVDPTKKADTSLFGTGADKSDPTVKKSNGQKMYYVGSDRFPFAFYLDGVNITEFQNTILKRENESKRIDKFFPSFLEWSVSEGMKSSDWYLHHLDSEIIETTE
jgi:LruC domain-containing protein